MAAPSEVEIKVIRQFRDSVKDIVPQNDLADDYFLLRWLRARDLDLEKAEAMLRNAIIWRKENNVDKVLERKIDPYFSKNFPRWIGSHDKEGRPVYCAAIGLWDTREVVKNGKQKGFQEYTTEGFELLLRQMKLENEIRQMENNETDPPITQMVSIFDFEGFAWSQLLNYKAVAEFLQLGSMYEAYYPETLYSAYFVNCPALISKVFGLLKPILAPKTMSKIQCFGTNKEEWQPELLKAIEVDQLMPHLGGTYGLKLNSLNADMND